MARFSLVRVRAQPAHERIRQQRWRRRVLARGSHAYHNDRNAMNSGQRRPGSLLWRH